MQFKYSCERVLAIDLITRCFDLLFKILTSLLVSLIDLNLLLLNRGKVFQFFCNLSKNKRLNFISTLLNSLIFFQINIYRLGNLFQLYFLFHQGLKLSLKYNFFKCDRKDL